MRKAVSDFAQAMEEKLRRHDDRRGWDECEIDFLFNRLLQEVAELHEVMCLNRISISTPKKVKDEAVDVANFAMMIWDRIIE